jgi:glycosyltransferase involved in cell wall biosynthesis
MTTQASLLIKFSLVLATVDRVAPLKLFLECLLRQTYADFELIVVDQNHDDRLVPLLSSYIDKFPIRHLRGMRGLSRARNVGLLEASGDIIAFPDDDCWYPDGLLQSIVDRFNVEPLVSGITGVCRDERNQLSVARWHKRKTRINRLNVWRCGCSVSMFLRQSAVQKVREFDETLGAGAGTIWGAGEETDYLVRCIDSGFRLIFDPDIVVGHPSSRVLYNTKAINRGRSYARGMGRVLRDHNYPLWFVLYSFTRPLGGAFLSLLSLKKTKYRYHCAILYGRISGWSNVRGMPDRRCK